MRVVLISQIPAAAHGLDALLRELGHEPIALLVARETDKRYGEDLGAHIVGAPAGLDVLVPASRDRVAPLLGFHEPDLAVCAGFPWKIPEVALAVPRLGIVNLHPSFLPLYRGPVPVGWAIRNGDPEFGVTLHRMDVGLDTGAMISEVRTPIHDTDTTATLHDRLAEAGAKLIVDALVELERNGKLAATPQPDDGATYAEKIGKHEAALDWRRPAGRSGWVKTSGTEKPAS